ncbi:TadE/TadG family type IV pilus assembly protein [Futiania mangrovi]|uniref:Pilus assembly protein n=1 Tax=Futiania mangrovi TaxID=2959716 RepID=A0A9J6PJZ4_9PROT|nr:TadE/TadG family type IV pilus assembly protein [Futiania mangrovii]MCP1336863.1 pilus assembly protein [Futiania mangrovii]
MFSRIRKYLKDRKGVAAIEFALIAPVMLTLYVGSAETVNLLSAERKMTNTSSSVADLIARARFIDDTELSRVFEAVDIMMQPYDTSKIKAVVSSVMAVEVDNGNGAKQLKFFVGWSDSANANDTAYAQCTEVTVPKAEGALVRNGESLIVARITHSYTPILPIPKLGGGILQEGFEMSETFYLKPRRLAMIPRCTKATQDACPWTPPKCI